MSKWTNVGSVWGYKEISKFCLHMWNCLRKKQKYPSTVITTVWYNGDRRRVNASSNDNVQLQNYIS